MSLLTELNDSNSSQDMLKNIQSLELLRKKGHKVDVKGPQAVYVDDHLMIFIYTNSFEDHTAGTRGEFEAGEIEGLLA